MDLMNKFRRMLDTYLQRQRVKRHRNITLRINYFQGLDAEYEKTLNEFKPKEEKLIETYHQESIAPINKLLDGTDKNDVKREKHLVRFEQKLYWQRRRLKVKSKDKSEKDLNKILADFDRQASINKKAFIEKLNQKYPHHDLSQLSRDRLNQKIDDLNKKKTLELDQMSRKFEKLKTRTATLIRKNQEKINLLKSRKDILSKQIISYNKQKQVEDQVILDNLEKKLKSIQASETPLEKKLSKLEQKITQIKTSKHLLENDDIHLSIRNLKMYFGGVKAVNDLSFDVKKGEIFGLIGPNGAGKTTVFNCITQFYKATSGHMVIRNKEDHIVNLYDLKTHDMIKEGIARSFQNVELIWELTVIDNLMVSAHSLLITNFYDHIVHTRKLYREDLVMRTKAMTILKDLGIQDYAYRSPYGLPYGILKKVELARTLMTNPSMIILDEPAAGLNDVETENLADIIRHINQTYKTTIFLVEHDMGLVMSICDTVCAISFGKLLGIGTPSEIQNNPDVRKAYLGDDQDE
jgi:ABC-type branched-subunit amino acid transport system ATPase component